MEETIRIDRSGLRKMVIFLVFGLFFMANAKAGLLAPSLTVSPATTNVSKGDTVTICVQSSVTIGVLSSISCQFSGGSFPTNASFTAVGGGALIDLGGSVDAVLTITNFSAATAGTYTFSSSTVGLLGGLLTSTATTKMSVTPTVTGMTSGSTMTSKGFKIQFSGPTGSNLVIQASTDMKHWTPICTNVITGGTVTWTDAAAMTMPGRYYRAMLK
ncbi:MAG TPA: hypothetical protein VMF08_07535 [Candidatus Sulfotelmatobacter sp.]|nr:hypothetical protein [Candidatus Sulfotelmatobacter sp.]